MATLLASFVRSVRTRGSNPIPREPNWFGTSATFGAPSDLGALQFSAVYACMRVISNNIAQLPVHVYQEHRDGAEQISPSSLDYLLKKPNPEVPRFTFWQTVFNHKVLTGNTYIFVQKDQLGAPIALWPVEPARVQVGREPSGLRRKVYLIDSETPMIDYALGGEILHIMGDSWDGMIGLSPIKLAASSFRFSGAAQDYGSNLLGNAGIPGGILTSEQEMEPPIAAEIGARWDAKYGGSNRGGSTAVLSSGTKWQQVTVSPVDAQLLETMQWTVTEWARWFNVPPHLIQDITKQSSWGTGIAEQKQGFLSGTLAWHYIPAEQVITNDLLGGGSRYMKFNTGGWLRGSIKEQYETIRIALGNQPFISQDEAREYIEKSPMGGTAAVLGTAVGGGLPAAEPAEEPKGELTETQRMALAFLDGDSYGKIAIDFGLQGADPVQAVKRRLSRHFAGSPQAMRSIPV